jgi:hypothetical protein
VIGFFVLLVVVGWHPQSAPKTVSECAPAAHRASALRADTDWSTIPCTAAPRA